MICPMQRKCINVPYINQSEQWPTGCESVSTVMALQHLGIDIDVDESVEQPAKYYRNNLLSLMNVLELMVEYGRRNVVFSSMSSI